MPLLLTEADVKSILTMTLALGAVEDSFRRLAEGSALLHFRQRLHVPGRSYMNFMAAADVAGGYMGLKVYTTSREGACFLVPLFSAQSGECLALIEADYLGQMRTGAATGVATRLLARNDAKAIGIVGTGLQARTQLEAVAHVRRIESVKAFSRDSEQRKRFAKEMSIRLGVPVTPASSAEEAVRGADVVVTSTTATNPVVEGRWLSPGMHINAIGVNFPHRCELDAEAVRRCDVIAADSRGQSKTEAGDLIQAFGDDALQWASVRELGAIVAGKAPGRTNAGQITLFKSNGVAIEDIVVAGRVYELARERGIGQQIHMWQKEADSREARDA
jgi:ornithine cyclodeaminase/alanine dehydrogenase-like protein (mu-crystallin family)